VAKDGAVEVGFFGGGIERGGRGVEGRPLQVGNVDGTNPLAGAIESGGGDDGLELADIAWPAVSGEACECAWGEAAERFLVLLAPAAEEESREERNVIFAIAEWGNCEADGGEVAGEVGTERASSGQTAQRLGRAGDELSGSGGSGGTDPFMGGAFEKIAEAALLFPGQFVDAGHIDEAGASFLPERLRLIDEFGGDAGKEGTGGRGAETMEGLRGEQFTGARFALDIDEAEVGGGASHASEEMLHDGAAAGHGAEHPSLRLECDGLKGLEVKGF
jgi:hypothetical protein